MTLVNRSLLSFSAAMLLAAIAGTYSVYTFDRIAGTWQDVQRVTRIMHAADQAEVEGLRASLMFQQYLQTFDTTRLARFAEARARAAAARQLIRDETRLPRVRELLDRYEALVPDRLALADEIVARVRAGQPPDAYAASVREREDLAAVARPYLAAIVRLENATMEAALADAQERRAQFRGRAIDLSALIIVMIGVISLLTSRRIARRLMPLLEMAQQVRRGNFKTRVPVRDSDEIATLSEAFNLMAADLQQLDAAKDEFVALASHQLRTPATAVRANLAMLLDGYFGELPPEQREVLGDAYDSNERQLEIVEDLLAVAQVETGRLSLAKQELDLGTVVEDVVSEHRLATQQRGQSLTVVRPTEPVPLPVDAPKLKMALDNLVSNASKYTPQGGAITVSLEARSDRVEFTVRDTGVGIAPEDQERLFRKFSRIHNPFSGEIGGTGLGLYLANEIVRLHGGGISVHSAAGNGATFRITLPRS